MSKGNANVHGLNDRQQALLEALREVAAAQNQRATTTPGRETLLVEDVFGNEEVKNGTR